MDKVAGDGAWAKVRLPPIAEISGVSAFDPKRTFRLRSAIERLRISYAKGGTSISGVRFNARGPVVQIRIVPLPHGDWQVLTFNCEFRRTAAAFT